MADITTGDSLDPEAARQAAIQRALGTDGMVSGGYMPPAATDTSLNQGYQYSSASPTIQASQPPTQVSPLAPPTNPNPGGISAADVAAMTRAAGATGGSGTFSAPQDTGAIQRAVGGGSIGGAGTDAPSSATTGGSIGAAITPKVPQYTAQQVADMTKGIKAPPTTGTTGAVPPIVTPPPPVTGTTTPGTPGTPNTGTPNTGTGTTGTPGTLTDLTSSITAQLQGLQQGLGAPGAAPDVTAAYLRGSQQILDMLNQQEATLRADAQKNGTTVDPATQFAITQLQTTLDANIKSTKEQLNSRGLYDSGIELSLENNLQKGSASDQAGILATRLSKLQADLQAGLTNIGNQRVSVASQYGLAGANAQSAADNNSANLAQARSLAATQGMLTLRGQLSADQNAQAARDQQAQQFSATQNQQASQFGASQAQQAQLATQAQNAAQTAAEAQRQFTAAQDALNRAATAANQQAAEQAAANLSAANNASANARAAATAAAAAAKPTVAGATTQLATTQAANAVLQSGQSQEDALAALQANAQMLQQQGVDLTALRTFIINNTHSTDAPPSTTGER